MQVLGPAATAAAAIPRTPSQRVMHMQWPSRFPPNTLDWLSWLILRRAHVVSGVTCMAVSREWEAPYGEVDKACG